MLNIPRYKLLYLLFDVATIALCLFLFTVLSIEENSSAQFYLSLTTLLSIYLLLIIILPFVFRYNNLYKINILTEKYAHFRYFTKAFLIFLPIVILFYFLSSAKDYLIFEELIVFLAYLYIFLAITRVVFVTKIYNYLSNKFIRSNVLIVGDGISSKLLAAQLFISKDLPIKIVGCISDQNRKGEEFCGGLKVVGNYNEIKEIVNSYKVNEIIIACDDVSNDRLLTIIDYCKDAKITVRVTSSMFQILHEKLQSEKYYHLPVLDIKSSSRTDLMLKYKRLFDIIFAITGIIFLSPIFILTAILVKVTSCGPVLYCHDRIGLNGKKFRFYKFRSMYFDHSDDENRKQDMLAFIKLGKTKDGSCKILNEEKITRVGRILRKTSIDELPQLFNVIKGDMSLVGPRPCLPYEYENYNSWQKKRVDIMPGCTGLWQVFGRNKVSFKDSVVMDIYYSYIMSPLTDLEYIVRTLPAMIFAKGK